jgi:hypothetical protein
MSELDPYFSNHIDENRQVVLAARPIFLAQGGAEHDGVVQIAANRDVVVIADEVTVRGTIVARRAPVEGVTTGPNGCTFLILARRLDTIPDSGADSSIDVSGGKGITSTKIWTAPAKKGGEGSKGRSIWHSFEDDVADGGTGKIGDTGSDGDAGGEGGAGGNIDIRCGFTATTTALALVANGGGGGNGLMGQQGGQGGPGGPGGDSEVGVFNPSAASKGGKGGPGGPGGKGGAPGKGGNPGVVRVRVRNGQPNGITASLQAGTPGTPGEGGRPGEGGEPGTGGRPWGQTGYGEVGGKIAPVAGHQAPIGNHGRGDDGDPGRTPDAIAKGEDNNADILGLCEDSELVKSLSFPLTMQTALLLDRIRVDFLAATGHVDETELSALADRVDWVNALLDAYTPASSTDRDELNAQRAAALLFKRRLESGHDFYGHAADFVPLGSIKSYQQRFTEALEALENIQRECDERVTALEQLSRTVSELDAAKTFLTHRLKSYEAEAQKERDSVAGLIEQIRTADEDAMSAKMALVQSTVSAFETAVKELCGISGTDFIEAISQFAFFGEQPFQASAMIIGEGLKLSQSLTSKVLTDDGTQVDKQWVINQLTATEFSAKRLQEIVGGESGVEQTDPGAVRLLAKQSEFDQLCDKFWSVRGADKAKDAFDDYVSAVQVRNAHVLSLNESLARLRDYVAAGSQTSAALAKAATQAAVSSDAGAATLVTQLTRMASRARADCIESLYLASRAYSFWAQQPADALAGVLTDLAAGRPLAMTPTALQAAGEQLLKRYHNAIEQSLTDRPIWDPPRDAAKTARGMMVEITYDSHPAVIRKLREHGKTSFELPAARANTAAKQNPFAGLSDVRLTSLRCWLHGLGWSDGCGPNVRVDLEHTGREKLVQKDDTVTVFRHEPVHIMMEYDSNRTLDPGGIVLASDLHDASSVGALIGPFARWRLSVSSSLNSGIDLSKVNKITLELHLCAYSFGMPKD